MRWSRGFTLLLVLMAKSCLCGNLQARRDKRLNPTTKTSANRTTRHAIKDTHELQSLEGATLNRVKQATLRRSAQNKTSSARVDHVRAAGPVDIRPVISGGAENREMAGGMSRPWPSQYFSSHDWVFIAYHKTGSSMLIPLVQVLCQHAGRRTYKHHFREIPERQCPDAGCCYVLRHLFEYDAERWSSFAFGDPNAGTRLVHLIRDPIALVVSGYLYHESGSEKIWTDSTSCSWDLCSFDDSEYLGLGRNAFSTLSKVSAQSTLMSYGCPTKATTYYDCLQQLPAHLGLEVEARRAKGTLASMINMRRIVDGDERGRNYCLKAFESQIFDETVKGLWMWLVAGSSLASDLGLRDAAVSEARVQCFDLGNLNMEHKAQDATISASKAWSDEVIASDDHYLNALSEKVQCASYRAGNNHSAKQEFFSELESAQQRTRGKVVPL